MLQIVEIVNGQRGGKKKKPQRVIPKNIWEN